MDRARAKSTPRRFPPIWRPSPSAAPTFIRRSAKGEWSTPSGPRLPSLTACQIDVQITKQYRNMGEGLAKEPRVVAYAQEAFHRLKRECKLTTVRGGTDGSQLTERGLPTPNLSTGEHNPHSPLEWTCLEEMEDARQVLVELVQVWGESSSIIREH